MSTLQALFIDLQKCFGAPLQESGVLKYEAMKKADQTWVTLSIFTEKLMILNVSEQQASMWTSAPENNETFLLIFLPLHDSSHIY